MRMQQLIGHYSVVQVDPQKELLGGNKMWLLALQMKNFHIICDTWYIKLREASNN